MPRPTNKNQLLHLSSNNFNVLLTYVESFTDRQKLCTFPDGYLNRNVRDVLAHLHHWHLLMIQWYTVGMKGDKPDIPEKGYTWKTVPDLNKEIQKKYSKTNLSKIINDLGDSHKKIVALINKHNDQELFEKKMYKWTGTTSLGAYFISATSSHYDWAFKLIKKCLKKN